MPTITYDKKDLLNLIGKKLSNQELEEVLILIKPNVENSTENELTLELTPDRPDLFGVEGLARAVKQYLGLINGMKKYQVAPAKLKIKASYIAQRPYLAAAVIKNVPMTNAFIKSMMNIQEVLAESIGRKRKKVAIGIHDFDKIYSDVSYAEASPDEKIVPLDMNEEMTLEQVFEKNPKGREYGKILSGMKKYPVYTDANGIFSFPPIINSERTRVTEKTKNLLVELTGTEKNAVLQTLNIIVTNFAERGCTIEAVKILNGTESESTPNLNPTFMELTIEEINRLIGMSIRKPEIISLFNRMGYDVTENKELLRIFIPAYRTDILHKIDLIEDVAIGYGFNNFIPQLPNLATVGKSHEIEKISNKVRYLMIGFGFQELIRPLVTNHKDLFEKMNIENGKVIEIENPVSDEYVCLRNWLLPSSMKVLSANKHVEYPQNVFEIGDVVILDSSEETMSKSVRKLACLSAHSKSGYAEIKSMLESLLKNMGVEYSFRESSHGTFLEGRCAEIVSGNMTIGIMGEISPTVLEKWGIEMPCSGFEIELNKI